jgi:SEC-C motif-containing protein
MTRLKCYCGSGIFFQKCCKPYIERNLTATSAEILMRSRYSAYVTHSVDYLVETTSLEERKHHSKEDILHWAVSNEWLKLEVINTSETTVEFKAFFLDEGKHSQVHHELSTFKKVDGIWYYVDGQFFG